MFRPKVFPSSPHAPRDESQWELDYLAKSSRQNVPVLSGCPDAPASALTYLVYPCAFARAIPRNSYSD